MGTARGIPREETRKRNGGRALPPALTAALREAGVEQLRAAPWWREVVQRERVVKSPAELELLRV